MPGPETTDATDPKALARFDTIIDVRSPAEFAEDHIPGAINLPVLSNEERAKVGTIYVQESRFLARKVGAALVARNVAGHLETALADKPGSFQPLIYCWRGGQRSNSMAIILAQIGWRTTVLSGGYRTYRRRVQGALYENDVKLRLVLLDGETGCGKTAILGELSARGVQTIDLEGIAQHRGSLFGGLPGQEQPSQKMFESHLLRCIEDLDPSRPVVVEAESSKVGSRSLPPALWKAMLDAPRIELAAPRTARARYLVETYADIVKDRGALEHVLARLPWRIGRKRREDLRGLAGAGDYLGLADAIMEWHYDPAYARSRRLDRRRQLVQIGLSSVDEPDRVAAADQIVGMLQKEAILA